MARMKYLGPVDPLRIPGIGPVGKEWRVVPDGIAMEFKDDPDFQIEFDSPSPSPLAGEGRGEGAKGGKKK